MNEWVAHGGKFSAVIATFIVIGLSWLVAWRLRTLLAPPGPPTTPNELGRSWAALAVFLSSIGGLSKFFGTFDLFSLVLWFSAASMGAVLGFALGWGYGKWFKFSNQPTPLPNAPPGNEPPVADESITISDHAPDTEFAWLFGEQLAFCEAFIGKNGLSYYLPKFEKFAQQEPKLTPGLNSFSPYKYTAKFFKPNWNWSSFFFTYGWALYRKLYGWSIALLLTSVFCFMAIKEGAAGLGFISLIAAYVAFGMYADALYYSKAKKIVLAAARTTRSKTRVRLEIGDKGGVNPWAGWVAAGQVLVGIPAILMVLLAAPAQQVPTTSNSPGQVSLPSSSEVMNAPKMLEVPPAEPADPVQEAPEVNDSDNYIRALYNDRRFIDLVEFVQNHLIQNPNDTLALNYSGLALQALGDMNGARLRFRSAIALNPESLTLYNNLASTYDPHTEYKTIIEILKTAQEIDLNNKLINDSLAAWQLYAQRMDAEHRAQTGYRNPSRSDIIPDRMAERRSNDDPECQVKPVMTDAEIRHWRICSPRRAE